MNWKLVVFSIVALIFLVNAEYVFAEISYPSTGQRLEGPPTYCIVEPVGMTTVDKNTYIDLAERGVADWSSSLVNIQPNPAIWQLDSRVISSSDSIANCTVVLHFYEEVEQISDGGTTVGIFRHASQSIDIAIKNLSLERIYNVIIHEIGHSLGSGHYVSDDNDLNKKFWSGNEFAPSIMIPTTHQNPALMGIMTVDVQRVYDTYGADGFYAFSPDDPPPVSTIPTTPIIPKPGIPEPKIPTTPIIPIFPFESIQIADAKILLKTYDVTYSKITGQIKDDVFRSGVPVYITIKNPDDSFDTHKLRTTSEGYFELPLRFDGTAKKGMYEVEASYLGHTDDAMDFVFFADFEQIVSTPTPKIEKQEILSSKESFGKYLEKISVQFEDDNYTVSAYLSQATSTQSIRITAENTCPFKKEVFQKDFLYRPGTEVSFSFHQLSSGKPDQCSIHFTMTDFNANLLDSVQVNYDIVKKTKTVIPTIPTNPTGSIQSLKNTEIPEWVKNNAKWWSEGLITDESFSTGIEYMIKEEIISIPQIQIENKVGTSAGKIPEWVKNNAKWWSEGLITDESFSTGLEYMIKEGIITI